MNNQKIKTGIEHLDNDINMLFKLAETGELEGIKQAIANKDLSGEEFLKIAKPEIIRIGVSLIDNLNFQMLLKQCDKSIHPILIDAKNIATKYLGGIEEHPAVLNWLKKHFDELKKEKQKELPIALNTISKLAPLTVFFDYDGKLRPAVRIGFLDQRNHRLLDTTMDWDDLIFLIYCLVSIAYDEFGKSAKLIDSNLLDISNVEKIGERLILIERNLLKIKDLAPKYGIDLDSIEKSLKDKDSG